MTELEVEGTTPVPDVVVDVARDRDGPELLVLQRCCWAQEAIVNDTLAIPALHESLADVRGWIGEWHAWCARRYGRLVGAVRARPDGSTWHIGRLMVAPDLAGNGLGRWLLAYAERRSPEGTAAYSLFTGARSRRNIDLYERAGYRVSDVPGGQQRPPGTVFLAKPTPAHDEAR